MVEFGILLVTYNRPEILKHTLRSLANQTYREFKIHLIDNGSTPPVDPHAFPAGLDIKFIRYEKNEWGHDLGNQHLLQVEGTHLLLLADDDVFVPQALEIVARVYESHTEVDNVSAGHLKFSHWEKQPCDREGVIDEFSGKIQIFRAADLRNACYSAWGIGPKCTAQLPSRSHASTSFFSRRVLEKTQNTQGAIWMPPFGDVGFLGTSYHTGYSLHIDCPLGIIGRGRDNEMLALEAGRRTRMSNLLPFLQNSPLKACTFHNLGVESHLKVLKANGAKPEDYLLRWDAMESHLREIFADNPWTEDSQRDIEKDLPVAFECISREMGYPDAAKVAAALRERISYIQPQQKQLAEVYKWPSAPSFADISEFADYIGQKCVKERASHLL